MKPQSRNKTQTKFVFKSCERVQQSIQSQASQLIDPEAESSDEDHEEVKNLEYSDEEFHDDNESENGLLFSGPRSPKVSESFQKNITPRGLIQGVRNSSACGRRRLDYSVCKSFKNSAHKEGQSISKQTTEFTSNISAITKKKKRCLLKTFLPPINEK